MNCAWQAYMNLVPVQYRKDVDRLGRETLIELRLRLGRPPELVCKGQIHWLDTPVTRQDLEFTINIGSQYSPWSAATTARGFLTASGGHRIGIFGDVSMANGNISTIATVTSVNIRVARDIHGIGEGISKYRESILIIGCPGSGKTTLLRDVVRRISELDEGAVAVIDERRELFPVQGETFCFAPGRRTDVLSGCLKPSGIEIAIRTMTPTTVALDEITDEADCNALLKAGWCGVRLIATAHAADKSELFTRQVYRPLLQWGLFQHLIVLHKDKSWHYERMEYEL